MLKKIDLKLCLVIGVVILLAGGLIWLALVFQIGKIRDASDNIQKEQLDSLVRDQRRKKILELGKELGDLENNQKEMNALLIDKGNAVPFLEALENTAALTGNSIKISVTDLTKLKSKATAKPVATTESDDESSATTKKTTTPSAKQAATNSKGEDYSNQLGFSVELAGKFGSLVDFLTKLDNMPYLVKVYNFQTTLSSKNESVQAAGSQAAPAPSPGTETSPAPEGDRDLDTKLTIGVYTNGSK